MATRLSDLVIAYELSNEIGSRYAYQLRYAVSRFQKYKSSPPTLSDLKPDAINRWLIHERDAGELSDRSQANVRRSILTLWAKFKSDLHRQTIRSVTVKPKNPEAWDYEEMTKVAAAASQLTGNLSNGLPRALYMTTCLWFAYETGLRRGDIWAFDLAKFDDLRTAAMTQHKTNRVHVIAVTMETISELRRMSSFLKSAADQHYNTPLRWPQSESTFYDWMKRCRALAAIDVEVRNRSLQHIRRTGATEIESEGGMAWRFLGHSREGLDRKSYIDARKTVSATMPQRNRSDHDRSNERASTMPGNR